MNSRICSLAVAIILTSCVHMRLVDEQPRGRIITINLVPTPTATAVYVDSPTVSVSPRPTRIISSTSQVLSSPTLTSTVVTPVATSVSPTSIDVATLTAIPPTPTRWPGNALRLDRSYGYVLVADNDSLDGFLSITVEAWVQANHYYGAIVSKYQHNISGDWDDSFYLGLNGGRVEWQISTGDSYSIVDGNTYIADGQWHHVAGTWDGTNQVIYVDGIQDASLAYSGNGQINSTDEPIIIGRSMDLGGPGRYLDGQIDEVRIWSLARGQLDVESARFYRLQGSEAGLMAYWPMDEAIGSTIVSDVSAHGNDGALQSGSELGVSTVPSD